MAKIIKEIIIMLLVCLLTMLVLAIALYRYIPNRKTVPEVVKYTASEDVQDLLDDNIDSKSDSDNVILTYEVTAGDLSGYQSTNTYVPGKSNPFAATTSSDVTEDNNNTGNSGNNSASSNNGGTSQGNTQTNPNQSSENSVPKVYQNNGTK